MFLLITDRVVFSLSTHLVNLHCWGIHPFCRWRVRLQCKCMSCDVFISECFRYISKDPSDLNWQLDTAIWNGFKRIAHSVWFWYRSILAPTGSLVKPCVSLAFVGFKLWVLRLCASAARSLLALHTYSLGDLVYPQYTALVYRSARAHYSRSGGGKSFMRRPNAFFSSAFMENKNHFILRRANISKVWLAAHRKEEKYMWKSVHGSGNTVIVIQSFKIIRVSLTAGQRSQF